MRPNRISKMEVFIGERNCVSMEELKEHFGVSISTVRRDVAELLRKGTIEKIYGGVCMRKPDHQLTPYDERRLTNKEAKVLIGQKAAELVNDRDIIFIDSGTTTLHLMDSLTEKKDLTVLTNNLDVVCRALGLENINLICLPGQLQRKTHSMTGDATARFLRQYNVNTAFIAATGVSAHGVTNSSPLEYEIKKTAVECCEQAVLMVSGEKFGVTGLMTFSCLDDFDVVVTDTVPPEEYRTRIREGQTRLIVAKP